MKINTIKQLPSVSNIAEYYGLKWSEYLQVKEKGSTQKGFLTYNPKLFEDFYKAVGIHNTAIDLVARIAQRASFQFFDVNGNEIDLTRYAGTRTFFEKSVKDVALYGYSFGMVQRIYNTDASYRFNFIFQGAQSARKSINEIYGVQDYHYYSNRHSNLMFNNPISFEEYQNLTLEKKKTNRRAVEVEVFDPSSPLVIQSLYIGAGNEYYDKPYYLSDDVLNSLVSLFGISEFLANNTVTGFFGGGIFNMLIPAATPEYCEKYGLTMDDANERLEEQYVAEAKKEFQGARNGGVLLISPQRNLNINPQTGKEEWRLEYEFTPFDSNFDPEKMAVSAEISKKTILSSHGLYKVLNEKDSGALNSNGADVIETAFELLYFTTVESIIKTALDAIQQVIAVDFPECTYNITPTQVLRSKTEFENLLNISTLNELRINRGLAPIDDLVGERFLNPNLNENGNGL